MRLKAFDVLACATITTSIVFSVIVAATSWTWFPTPNDRSHIAEIPKSMINYTALLLPPIIMLGYLLIRRLYFKKELPEQTDSKAVK